MSRIKLLRVIAAGGIALAILVQARPSQAQCETCITSNTQIRTVAPAISTAYYQPAALSTPAYYQAYRPTYSRAYRPGYIFQRPFRPFGGFFANLFGRLTYRPIYNNTYRPIHNTGYYGSTLADRNPCAQRVQRVCSYVPENRYRLQFINVPRTTLRPISSIDPCTGCERLTMKPVTEYVRRLQYVPYTTYRPVYKYVLNSPVCSTPSCSTSVCSTTPTCPTGACGTASPTVTPRLLGTDQIIETPQTFKQKPEETQNNGATSTRLKTLPRNENLNDRTAQNSSGLRLAVYRRPVQSIQQPAPKLTIRRIEEGGWVPVRKK